MRQVWLQLVLIAATALAVCVAAAVRTQLAAVAADATSAGQLDPPDLDPVDEPSAPATATYAIDLPAATLLPAPPRLQGRRAPADIFRPPN